MPQPPTFSRWLLAGLGLAGLLLAGASGCQKAGRYASPAPRSVPDEEHQAERPAEPEPLPPEITWADAPKWRDDSPRIEFVHATKHRREWDRLKGKSWVPGYLGTAEQAATVLALPGLAVGPLIAAAKPTSTVLVRVPLGLDDPAEFIPAANPPTMARWELGRRLFFDRSWLHKQRAVGCADCHDPATGFVDRVREHGGANTLSLVNSVFNRRQFWDGRVAYLEEVVQRSLDDEREPTRPEPFRHVWHGVIGRLQASRGWRGGFHEVFGTLPNQDAVGKALATYLRTILAGDSLHDRAMRVQQERQGEQLAQADYEAVLDEPAIAALGRAGYGKKSVARDLHLGYRLFHNLGEKKANCVLCHQGATFSDGGFHNLGVLGPTETTLGGRFASVPIGLKERTQVGAYRTPSLRGLSRTAPYLHTGEFETLEEVIRFHARGGRFNLYLDPLMRDATGQQRELDLTDAEVKALLLFLAALDGGVPDPKVTTPPPASE
jgi:cytochrome c peroxidase